MKKSMGLLSRAVLIGVSAAVLAAPAALATPVTGTPETGAEQPQSDVKERIAKYKKRVEQIEADLKDAVQAVEAAGNKAEAQKAKAAAEKVKAAADTLDKELQAFLDSPDLKEHQDRIAVGQVMHRAQEAIKAADAAITKAQKKIDDDQPTPPVPAADIAVEPQSAGRGGIVAIVVFCPEGKVSNFASDALNIVAESRYEDGPITAIGAIVKEDAAPGKHSVTASCDSQKLTASFTVTADAPVQSKPPTSDDVRRKSVVKPKGKIETGGGATALQTV
ncbi:hypothetical protein [Kibdelosporangium aridum]|nr:hypothetical protein [Kibdelosporangium aridum]